MQSAPTELDHEHSSFSLTQIEVHHEPIFIQSPPPRTCIQIATDMIDKVTNSMVDSIGQGKVRVHRQKKDYPSKINENHEQRSMMLPPPVDMDEHRKMIRRFKRQNRKLVQTIQQRSIEFEQSLQKKMEEQIRLKSEEKVKMLEERRKKIEQRLKQKADLMRQIRRSVVQSNQRFQSVKKKKFLHQIKQEVFEKQFILPKLEQQKKILSEKKQKLKPMDIESLLTFEKQYEEKKVHDRINRSLTSRVISQTSYNPPAFVPKSFLISEAEEEIRRQEEKIKNRQTQINAYRKKQFLKGLQEKQKMESEIKLKSSESLEKLQGKDKEKAKDRDKDTLNLNQRIKIVEKNRQETKKIGNQYFKQVLQMARKQRTKRNLTSTPSISTPKQSLRPKSEYEIEIIRSQRVEQVQRFRLRKVDELLHDEKMDPRSKYERLKYETQRLDELAKQQQQMSGRAKGQKAEIKERDEAASMYLNSIHAKLALLEVVTSK